MNSNDYVSFNDFDPTQNTVLDEIKRDIETKGSLDITAELNKLVKESKLLTLLEKNLPKGQKLFRFAMRSPYAESMTFMAVSGNVELHVAALPPQASQYIYNMATAIERESGGRNTLFRAVKKAIELSLTDAGFQLDFEGQFKLQFTEHWTSESKKERIANTQAANAEPQFNNLRKR
jgi:hypothetical protein